MAWIGPLFHLAMIPAAILMYMFFGLMPSVMVTLGIMTAMLLTLKIAKQKIEAVYWIEYGFLLGFGLPAILINSPLLVKLQETISGLVCGLGFTGWAYFREEPIIKSLIPQFVHDFLERHPLGPLKRILNETPDPVWKKIDYLWGIEMILSAAISLAVALIFPTDIWFYAKYLIGPVLTFVAFGIQATLMHNATRHAPVITPTVQPVPEPTVTDSLSPSSKLIHSNIYKIEKDVEEGVDQGMTFRPATPQGQF